MRVPDLGEFRDVEVIEILVAPGDRVAAEQSLITLESDKASMEIPSPAAGVVVELAVAEGAHVSEGSPILVLELTETARASAPAEPAAAEPEAAAGAPAPRPPASEAPPRPAPAAPPPPPRAGGGRLRTDVLVLGGGPGGYTAAFRAADLGRQVVLVERYPALGGVCLHVGCIPSKALLHVAEVIRETQALAAAGVDFGAPKLDLPRLRARRDAVVKRLADGLGTLARQRRRPGAPRRAAASRPRTARASRGPTARRTVDFDHAIVAVGSRPSRSRPPRRPALWTRPTRSRSTTCRRACSWSAAA